MKASGCFGPANGLELPPTFHLGTGVAGKTLGILGLGRIGRELAEMARGLRMRIHYRNRSRLDAKLEAGAIHHDDDAGFLAACDFLSINVLADHKRALAECRTDCDAQTRRDRREYRTWNDGG